MNELQGFDNDAFSKANKKPVSFDKIKIKTYLLKYLLVSLDI
jgi:hypothetical protein